MCDDDDCCKTVCKVLLIIINTIFLLAGLLMLGFGIAAVAAPDKCLQFLVSSGIGFNSGEEGSNYILSLVKMCGVFMIVIGAITAIIAIFGFFGAVCDNKCMLVTYAILLIIIVCGEIALIIFAAVYPKNNESWANNSDFLGLRQDFQSDIPVSSNGTLGDVGIGSGIWAGLQLALGCCGSNNYTDYATFNWTRTACTAIQASPACVINTNYKVPLSCCMLKSQGFPTNVNNFVNPSVCISSGDPQYTNTQGCTAVAINLVSMYGRIAIGIAAGIVGLEIIMIILAFIMCCRGSGSNKFV